MVVPLLRVTAQDILPTVIKSFMMGFALLGNSSLGQINLKLLVSATLLGVLQSLFSLVPGYLSVVVSLVFCFVFNVYL